MMSDSIINLVKYASNQQKKKTDEWENLHVVPLKGRSKQQRNKEN